MKPTFRGGMKGGSSLFILFRKAHRKTSAALIFYTNSTYISVLHDFLSSSNPTTANRMDPVEPPPPRDPGYTDDESGLRTQDKEDTKMADTENWEENDPEYSQLSVFEEKYADDVIGADAHKSNKDDEEMMATPKKLSWKKENTDGDILIQDATGKDNKEHNNDITPAESKPGRHYGSSTQNEMADINLVPRQLRGNKYNETSTRHTVTEHTTMNQKQMNQKQINMTQK